MAIQVRRGSYSDLDPAKLLPGEPAVTLSDDPGGSGGRAAYVCVASGDVRRLVTTDDLAAAIADANQDAAKEIVDAATSQVAAAEATRQSNEATRQSNETARQATYVKSAAATTLAAGSSATATISNNVLTIGVPQGAKGDKGDKGDAGSADLAGATGTLAVAHGGTGAATADAARAALGACAAPTVLYSDTTGTAGTVTLSETAANFRWMEITYSMGTYGEYGPIASTTVWSPDDAYVTLFGMYFALSTTVQINTATVHIDGTKISKVHYGYANLDAYGNVPVIDNTQNNIAIQSVVGWR